MERIADSTRNGDNGSVYGQHFLLIRAPLLWLWLLIHFFSRALFCFMTTYCKSTPEIAIYYCFYMFWRKIYNWVLTIYIFILRDLDLIRIYFPGWMIMPTNPKTNSDRSDTLYTHTVENQNPFKTLPECRPRPPPTTTRTLSKSIDSLKTTTSTVYGGFRKSLLFTATLS